MYYVQHEISERTSFDAGERFTSEQDVRDYFALGVMREMFPEWGVADELDEMRDDDALQDELDEMADAVIAHRWHCDFGDGVGYAKHYALWDGSQPCRLWFSSEQEMFRADDNLRQRGWGGRGEVVLLTRSQFASEEGIAESDLTQSRVLTDPEPFGWTVSPE